MHKLSDYISAMKTIVATLSWSLKNRHDGKEHSLCCLEAGAILSQYVILVCC
jgi:hypothetical protein